MTDIEKCWDFQQRKMLRFSTENVGFFVLMKQCAFHSKDRTCCIRITHMHHNRRKATQRQRQSGTPDTKMHSEYQDAFRIPRCIPNTKMHSEYQDAFRIPRCIPNTKMHSLFERIANGDPHPKHPSFRLSMPLGLGKQKENKSIVNPNV
eukprot:Selendium_serpulae@DN5290_c1_g1_i3.p1